MTEECEIHVFMWRGIEIEARYWPRFFGDVRAKLEIRGVKPDRAPMPISLTGFKVCYPAPGEIEAQGGDVAGQVLAWLDEDAGSREWKAHVEKCRQGELF